MTSSELPGISNHWQINCLFSGLFTLAAKKTQSPALLALCAGNPLMTAQRASKVESVSMSWHHHAIFHFHSLANLGLTEQKQLFGPVNIKDCDSKCRDSHYKDKTELLLCCLYIGNSYTGKTLSLYMYWIGPMMSGVLPWWPWLALPISVPYSWFPQTLKSAWIWMLSWKVLDF